MADQGLLVVVERCLEGTEEVTNPKDAGHYDDDHYHSFDGDVNVHLVLDALLSLDERLFLDVYLDDLFGLGDEFQSPTLDDGFDLLGQQDVCYLLHVDIFADGVHVVEVDVVLPALLPALDVGVADVVLLLYHDVEVVEDDGCWSILHNDDLLLMTHLS